MLKRIRKNSLVSNTVWMMIGQLFRFGIQGAGFVLLARALGPADFGRFSGVLAFISILAPFSGLGGGNLLIMKVARDRKQFSACWGNALFLCLFSGIAFIVFAVLIGKWIFSNNFCLFISLIALSELLFMRVVEVSSQAFQAIENISMTAKIQALPGIFRLVAVVCFMRLTSYPPLLTWGILYLSSCMAAALVSCTLVLICIGGPKVDIACLKKQMLPGFFFSLGISAKSVYADIDKTMLVRLSTADATGIYVAGYRLISFAFTPILSLLSAGNARFFRSGQRGLIDSINFAKRLMPYSVAYSLLAAVMLYAAAPLSPLLLGEDYIHAVDAVRLLAIVPLIQTFHYLFADSLTGAGFQHLRSVVQVFIALFNVLINFWLIPLYSWKGAAWATIISESLLGIILFGLVAWLLRKPANVTISAVG